MIDQEWFTQIEAARYLRVSTRTLRRLSVRRYPIPGAGKGRRPHPRYRREELDALLAGRRRTA